jgi:tetratricopeptide (TPR) repeat protein
MTDADRRRPRTWPAWIFIALAAPTIYIVIRSGPAQPVRTSVPIDLSNVPTISQESLAHELVVLRQQLEENPDHVPVLLQLSQVSRDLGQREQSIEYLRQALEADPEHTEARLELGRALYESGDLQGAVTETTRIVEQDPTQVDALYNLGAIYGNMMDQERAREYWQRAGDADPDSTSGKLAARGLEALAPTR